MGRPRVLRPQLRRDSLGSRNDGTYSEPTFPRGDPPCSRAPGVWT